MAASPRLLAVVPRSELEPLLVAWAGANKAVEAAKSLPVEGADIAGEVDAQLRAGTEVDPAALMDRLAVVQEAQARRDRTVELLAGLPGHYIAEIARLLDSYQQEYYEALDTQLGHLLDEAEAVVAELGGAVTAEEVIRAEKGAQWLRLHDLAREYADLRADQLKLLREEDNTGNYAPGSVRLAGAFFRNLADVEPDFFRVMRDRPTDLRGRPEAAASWPVLDHEDFAHFLHVVRNRAALSPHVVDAEEAAHASAPRIVVSGIPVGPRESGRLTPGSRDFQYMITRAQNAVATDIANQRAWGIED